MKPHKIRNRAAAGAAYALQASYKGFPTAGGAEFSFDGPALRWKSACTATLPAKGDFATKCRNFRRCPRSRSYRHGTAFSPILRPLLLAFRTLIRLNAFLPAVGQTGWTFRRRIFSDIIRKRIASKASQCRTPAYIRVRSSLRASCIFALLSPLLLFPLSFSPPLFSFPRPCLGLSLPLFPDRLSLSGRCAGFYTLGS